MKKLFALLLALVMVLSLAACGEDESVKEEKSKKKTTSQSGDMDMGEEDPVESQGSEEENLMNYPESPEEDFQIVDIGNGEARIEKYLGDDEIVVIPETIQGLKPTELIGYLFRNTPTVKAIRLCDSVRTIGNAAFSFNENIEIVVFGAGVRELGESAFMQADGIRTVVLNQGLESIGPNCFQSCSVQRLEIPGTVKEIGQMAFTWCDAQEIILGEGITQLGNSVFFCCSQLTSVVIPDSMTRLNKATFSLCTALTSVVIPDGVKEIEERAFEECTALTEITLPDGLERIGSSSFASCTSLSEIDIPDTVTSIGEKAFKGCTGLTTIDVPDSVTEIGEEAFFSCELLIGGEGSCAQQYAIKNGIAFQVRGGGPTVGGEAGYVANLPEDLILSVNGVETSLLGKGGVEIMEALGLEYKLRSGANDPSIPQYVTYDADGDAWLDIIVDENYTDSGNGIYVDHITVRMGEGITILGMTSGATIYEAFNILGQQDDKDLSNYLFTYYWYDVQIGDTVIEKITIDTFDDTFHELTIWFNQPTEG